jgi:hypothetical protein
MFILFEFVSISVLKRNETAFNFKIKTKRNCRKKSGESFVFISGLNYRKCHQNANNSSTKQ